MIVLVVLTVVVLAATVVWARFLTRFATALGLALYGTTDEAEIERVRQHADR